MTFASEIDRQLFIPAHRQSAWNAMKRHVDTGYLVLLWPAMCRKDRLGRRAVSSSLYVVSAAAAITANLVANNPAQFLGGEIFTGFAVGLILADIWRSHRCPCELVHDADLAKHLAKRREDCDKKTEVLWRAAVRKKQGFPSKAHNLPA
jgi:hypothetical protein